MASHYLCREVGEMLFLVKMLLIQPLKVKKILPNLKYQLKINAHPWSKTLQKDNIQLSNMTVDIAV